MKIKILYFFVFAWIVLAAGCRERFDPLQSDETNNAFIPNDEPITIKVISPRTGDVFQTGDDLQIRWQTTGTVNYLTVQLFRGSELVFPITVSTTNDEVLTWYIPNAVTSSSNYRIRVVSGENNNVYSFSEIFTIRQLN